MRQPAQPGTRPQSASLLRDRLVALNRKEIPVQVIASPDDDTIEVTWRYADAHWFDLMRAHKLQLEFG